MVSDEISEKDVEAVTEANLRSWMQVLACIIVTAGVCWCGYATWCEETAASTTVGNVPTRDLMLFCTHPEVGMWLPASGALGSLIAGICALASGRSCTRFLLAGAALVTAKALTLTIEVMLRLP
jgi:hypothetical protein